MNLMQENPPHRPAAAPRMQNWMEQVLESQEKRAGHYGNSLTTDQFGERVGRFCQELMLLFDVLSELAGIPKLGIDEEDMWSQIVATVVEQLKLSNEKKTNLGTFWNGFHGLFLAEIASRYALPSSSFQEAFEVAHRSKAVEETSIQGISLLPEKVRIELRRSMEEEL